MAVSYGELRLNELCCVPCFSSVRARRPRRRLQGGAAGSVLAQVGGAGSPRLESPLCHWAS